MNKVPRLLIGLAALTSFAFATSAQAAPVTIGVQSTSGVFPGTVGSAATLLTTQTNEPGAKLTSPISGAVIRWRITGFTGGPWRLRVLTPLGGLGYLGGGTSGPETPSSLVTQTYVTSLPIQAGQTIAVQNTNAADKIGILAGGNYTFFAPPLGEGATGTAAPPAAAQFAFNADVLPPPGIATAGPTSGSIRGGTPVVIAGHDFIDVSAVKFGGLSAQSFAVASENAITAVAPQSTKPGPVTISVTTPAGTATAAAQFSYTACVVPNVAGKKLKGAKKRLRKAGCGVGKVKFLGGATAKTGKVTKQNPKAGKVLAPGVKVNIKLAA